MIIAGNKPGFNDFSRELPSGNRKPVPYTCTPYYEEVKRFDEFGRRRSDVEIVILTLLRYLKLLLERMKRMIQIRKAEVLEEQIGTAEKQIRALDKALHLASEYQIQDVSDIIHLQKTTGHHLSDARKTRDALSSNLKVLDAMSGSRPDGSEVQEDPALAVAGPPETPEEPKPSSLPVSSGTPPLLAAVSPMAPIQRRDLFSLSKDSGFRVRCSFDRISAGEAEEAIRFLKGRCEGKSEDTGSIPRILRQDYAPCIADPASIEEERKAVLEEIRISESEAEKYSKEYKDLVFLYKVLSFSRKECRRLEKARGIEAQENRSRERSISPAGHEQATSHSQFINPSPVGHGNAPRRNKRSRGNDFER